MRNPDRINRIINKIQEMWVNNPDLRFLQLMEHVNTQCKNKYDYDLFYLEDDLFEEILDKI